MSLADVRSRSVGGSFVVYSLFIVTNIICGGCVRSLFCYAVIFALSCFVVISLGTRELVALLLLSSWCHVDVLFFARGVHVATYTQKRIFVHIWTQNMGIFYHNSDGFLMLCFKTCA